ncbi:hypothetical protein [Biostraticola tofi]|nr:hypothetical protein [Biostraticola tofi]
MSTPAQTIKWLVTPKNPSNCSKGNTDAFSLKAPQALPQSKAIEKF